jgi:hypothetical protein
VGSRAARPPRCSRPSRAGVRRCRGTPETANQPDAYGGQARPHRRPARRRPRRWSPPPPCCHSPWPGQPTRRRRRTDRPDRRRPAPRASSSRPRPARSGSPAGGVPAARPRLRFPLRARRTTSTAPRHCSAHAVAFCFPPRVGTAPGWAMQPSAHLCRRAWTPQCQGPGKRHPPPIGHHPAAVSATWQMIRDRATDMLQCTRRFHLRM